MSNRLMLIVGGVAAVLILVLAAVLVIVVAGGDDGDGDNGDPAAEATEAPDDGDDDDDDDDTPAAAGELRLRGEDPLVLDPAIAQDAGSAFYLVEIFSGLVRMDKNLQVQPDIAERWEISPDGLTYTFHIAREAKFHDGKPVLAEDIKYSWERALDPATASIVSENFLGDIVGARDVSRGRATEISGVRVIDDATIEVITFRFTSAEEFASFFRTWYGPTLKAFASLEGDARDALEADLIDLARRADRLDGNAIAIPATYTEAVAVTR